jgi:hypothetical protein
MCLLHVYNNINMQAYKLCCSATLCHCCCYEGVPLIAASLHPFTLSLQVTSLPPPLL